MYMYVRIFNEVKSYIIKRLIIPGNEESGLK